MEGVVMSMTRTLEEETLLDGSSSLGHLTV